MTDERSGKTRDRMRESVIRGLVVLAFSPIGIFVGFFLNDYLAREKLTIAHIELIPVVDHFLIEEDTRDAFRRSDAYRNYLRNDDISYRSILRLAIDDGEPVSGEQRASFVRQLDRMITYMRESENVLVPYLEHIKADSSDSPIPDELIKSIMKIGNIVPLVKPRDDRERQSAIVYLEQFLRETLQIRIRASGLKARAEIYRPSRTGQLQVVAVVLNRGNTDGLVRGRGELEMVDQSRTVYLTAYQAEQGGSGSTQVIMKPVPKRSVTTLIFWVDDNRSPGDAAQALAAALTNNNDSRVLIRLMDTSNRPMESEILTLPVGPSN